jgi:predicted AAA+ superfamily ATPase
MTHMISRTLFPRISKILQTKSILLLGPRQVGKSTFVRNLEPDFIINLANESEYLAHLKDPSLIEKLVKAKSGKSFGFIDEVQRIPSILNTIQSLIDENKNLRFAFSGSSARKLMRGKANLLPGRVIYEKLYPLTYWEIQATQPFDLEKALTLGTLPEVYLTDLGLDILETYVEIYLREEIQAEALTQDLGAYSRFLDLAAEVSGQFINYSKIASESEIDKEKVRRFFQILQDSLMIYRLESYGQICSNRKARQKDRFFFFDNGVRNTLLKKHRSSFTPTELGPLFESWIFLQLQSYIEYQKKPWKLSTYRDEGHLEIDLILETSQKTYLLEIKYQSKYRKEFVKNLFEFEQLHEEEKKFEKRVLYIGRDKLKDGPVLIQPYTDFFEELATMT